MLTFNDLGLRDELLQAISSLGFENPMPVQEQVIPYLLNNQNDIVALAQTGTGKTAAFGLPLLTLTDEKVSSIQSLILAPTRELCIQIANDLKRYAQHIPSIRVVAVYGGESIVNQFRQLDVQPQVLVATPGRLIDLIERGKVKLSTVKHLVLDEADEMLNMGFKDDLETILQEVPSQRRTMLFSATMPSEIARIAKTYMQDAHEIAVGTRNAGSDNVDHIYYMVAAANRYLALKRIVDINPDIYGIVFCRTRQETKDVAEKLMRDGYNADALHGDLSQAQRDTVMQKFRIHNLQILVATDVAARGLDVSDLTHVINYNLPDDVEVYTHRSGRTGRAGKKGTSCVIIHSRERKRLRDIERIIKREFKQMSVPQGIDVCRAQLFHLIDRMENVDVNLQQIEQFMPQISAKLEYLSKEDIISRFVSLEFNRFLEYYKDAIDINLPAKPEKESRSKKRGGNRVRLKLNYGFKQNASPRSILGVINEATNDKSISVGDIEITNKFSFFDVYEDQADQVINAFQQNGGALKVTVAQQSDLKSKEVSKKAGGKRRYSDSQDSYGSKKNYERKNTRRSQRSNDNYQFDPFQNPYAPAPGRFRSSGQTDETKPWRRKK